MEIKIEDYLSKENIQKIIEEEIREQVKETFINEREATRIISNLGYRIVMKQVEEIMPGAEKQLERNVIKTLEKLSTYEVFRSKRHDFENRNSLAQDILEEAVTNNKKIIEDKVVEILKELEKSDISYEIKEIMEEKIDRLFINKEEN